MRIMTRANVQPHELEKSVDTRLHLSLQIVPTAGDKMPEQPLLKSWPASQGPLEEELEPTVAVTPRETVLGRSRRLNCQP